MKIAILNTYANLGGAAIATYRLHQGLISIAVDSRMVVMHKGIDDPTVYGPEPQNIFWRAFRYQKRREDENLSRSIRSQDNRYFSPARCPDKLSEKVDEINPDVVHLSWVNDGFLKIETIKKFRRPIIWTFHDMWPFTGGCHYDDECSRYHEACGKCPVLGSKFDRDLSRQIWERKSKSWSNVPIVAVTPSRWMADMARSSALFKSKRIEVIPNGIDTDKFKPIDKSIAREAFGLPYDKHLVLFSALGATTDRRKGNQFLMPALKKIAQQDKGENIELMVIGASKSESPSELGMKVHYMGLLHDEISMALLYSAADITVAPSMQENLSNSVMESLSCGTPVVAFNIGGMPEIIDHQSNGYLAAAYDSNELAGGIMWVLNDKTRHENLSRKARNKVTDHYALKAISKRYLALYQDVLRR